MGNVYVKDAGDFSSADQKNLGLYFEERKRGLAVFFPGIGYHTDKPLLYYGKKLATGYGCEIMEMSYGELPTHIKGNHEKMMAAFEKGLSHVTKLLEQVDFSRYEKVLFVSKSIGTAVAAAYAMKNRIDALHIYYTPVEESFQAIGTEGVVFHGTADPWARTDVIRQACEERGLPLYLTEGANHSLETGNVQEDLKNLEEIMRVSEEYIRRGMSRM